jgi:hypothetical protein
MELSSLFAVVGDEVRLRTGWATQRADQLASTKSRRLDCQPFTFGTGSSTVMGEILT